MSDTLKHRLSGIANQRNRFLLAIYRADKTNDPQHKESDANDPDNGTGKGQHGKRGKQQGHNNHPPDNVKPDVHQVQ
jgi:hypothetical protein